MTLDRGWDRMTAGYLPWDNRFDSQLLEEMANLLDYKPEPPVCYQLCCRQQLVDSHRNVGPRNQARCLGGCCGR